MWGNSFRLYIWDVVELRFIFRKFFLELTGLFSYKYCIIYIFIFYCFFRVYFIEYRFLSLFQFIVRYVGNNFIWD